MPNGGRAIGNLASPDPGFRSRALGVNSRHGSDQPPFSVSRAVELPFRVRRARADGAAGKSRRGFLAPYRGLTSHQLRRRLLVCASHEPGTAAISWLVADRSCRY